MNETRSAKTPLRARSPPRSLPSKPICLRRQVEETMFEAVIIASMAISGISTVQTGIALDSIQRNAAMSNAMATQSLILSGTSAGKTIRTLRYCKADGRANAYYGYIVGKMSQFGDAGRLMIDTTGRVASLPPDMSMKPKNWTCAAFVKSVDVARAGKF